MKQNNFQVVHLGNKHLGNLYLGNEFTHSKYWTKGESLLSLRMMKTWTDFARDGNPKIINRIELNDKEKTLMGLAFMVPSDKQIDLSAEIEKIQFHKKYMFPSD